MMMIMPNTYLMFTVCQALFCVLTETFGVGGIILPILCIGKPETQIL